MNWPNRITILRITLVPVFILAVFYHEFNIAFVIFVLASVTDALDGYLARVRKEKTRLGSILDPIADKMLIGSAFVSLALVAGVPQHLQMPGYVPIIIISRDVMILTGVAILHIMNVHIVISPTILGKMTTVLQMATIIAVLLRFPRSSWLWNAAVLLTVVSGLDYLRIASRSINEK